MNILLKTFSQLFISLTMQKILFFDMLFIAINEQLKGAFTVKKLELLQTYLKEQQLDAAFITTPDNVFYCFWIP